MILRYVSHFSQMLGCLIVESSNQNNGFFTRWQQAPGALMDITPSPTMVLYNPPTFVELHTQLCGIFYGMYWDDITHRISNLCVFFFLDLFENHQRMSEKPLGLSLKNMGWFHRICMGYNGIYHQRCPIWVCLKTGRSLPSLPIKLRW